MEPGTDGAAVRVTTRDCEPWFVAADVCAALDVQNVTQAVARLDDDERSLFNIGRQGDASIINESGLYSLILGSRKPEAKRFKKWVTADVLPAIRKTVQDAGLTTDSRRVAKHFGKAHKNVLQSIDRLDCSEEFRRLNFQPTMIDVPGPKGATRQERQIQMTKDGFMFLAMSFTGKETSAVRFSTRDGEPWFVAADVCGALDITNVGNATARLDDDERTTIRSTDSRAGQGAQSFTIINESGLYSLVLGSRKPEAKRFKKWVTAEVLPRIAQQRGVSHRTGTMHTQLF